MAKNDGGPAFPQSKDSWTRETGALVPEGMSLRDYFAAKAMQGMMANTDYQPMGSPEHGNVHARYFADMAYRSADAMLAERAKP